jgi:predicted phage terminase large subunit-like protein
MESINLGTRKRKILDVGDMIANLLESQEGGVTGWNPRPNQLPPDGDWHVWLICAGRGWGKTRTAAEFVIDQVKMGVKRIHIIGQTAADVRDVMVEGPSGLVTCSPPGLKPIYEPSKRRVTWPNGASATTFTAEKPQQLRGPECELLWCDEIDHWKYPDTWDMAMFGLRKGPNPRAVATSTPKPTGLVRRLKKESGVAVVTGATWENRDNLASSFLDQIVKRFEGTRLERQELYGEVLEAVEGALWGPDLIERALINEAPMRKMSRGEASWEEPDFLRVVVAADPNTTYGEDADETGIIVAGLGRDDRAYIIADRTVAGGPHEWARAIINAYTEFKADRVIGEVNNGGDLVETTLRGVAKGLPFRKIHASRGKRLRAEPVAALYEQGRVKHIGRFPQLEEQMCSWTPETTDYSPDRMDAMVYAVTELLLGGASTKMIGRAVGSQKERRVLSFMGAKIRQ